jgi:Putative collagen-binding domain of a collagenase/Family of unknown function (DUF6298)
MSETSARLRGFLQKRYFRIAVPAALLVFIADLSFSIQLHAQAAVSNPPIIGELSVSANHHYFKDGTGRPILLNGSQTWNTLQDWGTDGAPQPVDFDQFVKFLTTHGHNFTLLWTVEMPKFCNLPVVASDPPQFTVSPFPWERTGPGNATDGGLKFDLTKYDPQFFNRLRSRVESLNRAGVYAGVYLFTGEFLNVFRCADDGYPFTGANNVNGVDDGYAGGTRGIGSVIMTAPNPITKYQDAYVDKVIDTLNDLPNVLWIVSEEAPPQSLWWNRHLIAHIRAYESTKPHLHPIGYAAPIGVRDTVIYDSDADWVAPWAKISPASSCGAGKPSCKVNINDSDHTYFGMWNDSPRVNRNWAWENFASGNQVLFMDPYVVDYPREDRNHCVGPYKGICAAPDPRWENVRNTLGYILKVSRKLNRAEMAPHGTLSSTGFCLAQATSTEAEYLVYAPTGGVFTVDLSAMQRSRQLAVEWFNPATGAEMKADPVSAGSTKQTFTPPFAGDAVLVLRDAAIVENSGGH